MNILYITNHLNTGGITSYVLTLASGMKKKGHNIFLASSGGELLSRFRAEGINYIPIPIKTKQEAHPKIIFSALKLKSEIKKHKIDIVHTHSRTTQVVGCLLHKISGIPHISTCHGFFKTRFFRRVFPCWGQKTIAISAQVKEHLANDFKVHEQNIAVIHNGIDVERFKAQDPGCKDKIREGFGLGDGPVIGIVARLSDVKGHIYLIQAMKQVLEQIPGAQLLIAGEGKMKEELVKLTRDLGIEKRVFFVPNIPDTSEVLQAIDVFVMPSLKEGLGLALMEAMAAGLAVVGSNIGGIKSLIKNNVNGLLVEPADTKGLAGAISKLLKDPQKRGSFGNQAREFIAQNFSQEKMVAETERVYLECLKLKN